MTDKKIKKLEATLKPCKCGGRLRVKIAPNGTFAHAQIKCEKCGAWHGGITIPVEV